jgi:hypothetical protein
MICEEIAIYQIIMIYIRANRFARDFACRSSPFSYFDISLIDFHQIQPTLSLKQQAQQ